MLVVDVLVGYHKASFLIFFPLLFQYYKHVVQGVEKFVQKVSFSSFSFTSPKQSKIEHNLCYPYEWDTS